MVWYSKFFKSVVNRRATTSLRRNFIISNNNLDRIEIYMPLQTPHSCLKFPNHLDPLKMTRLKLATLSSLRVSRHQIPAHNLIPNTSIQRNPLLIYHSCIPPSASASSIETHLREVGIVSPQWRYS